MKNRIFSPASRAAVFIIWVCALMISQHGAFGESPSRSISAQFQVKLFDDTVVSYKDIQGKVTVIDFWGTWCKPCLAEIPDYKAFYRDYKDKGVIFMALASDSGKPEKVREALKRLDIDYPVGAPSREEFKAIGKIRVYPTTWVIGRDGAIEKQFVGVIPGKKETIRETVDRLLKDNAR